MKIFIGIAILMIFIALLFGFATQGTIDYTFIPSDDAESSVAEFQQKFENSIDLNASMIDGSVSKVITAAEIVIGKVRETFSDKIFKSSKLLITDDLDFNDFFNPLRDGAEQYIKVNYGWFKRIKLRNYLNNLVNALHGQYVGIYDQIELAIIMPDLMQYTEWYGWSVEDVTKIHDYMIEHGVYHIFDGEEFLRSGGGGIF